MEHRPSHQEYYWNGSNNGSWVVDDGGDVKPIEDYPDLVSELESKEVDLEALEVRADKMEAGHEAEAKQDVVHRRDKISRSIGEIASYNLSTPYSEREPDMEWLGHLYNDRTKKVLEPFRGGGEVVMAAYSAYLNSVVANLEEKMKDLEKSDRYKSESAAYEAAMDLADRTNNPITPEEPATVTEAYELYRTISDIKQIKALFKERYQELKERAKKRPR